MITAVNENKDGSCSLINPAWHGSH